jgi:hypothetical protein
VRPASGVRTEAAASARTVSSARRIPSVRPATVSMGSAATPPATAPARCVTWSASKAPARRRRPGTRIPSVRARIPRPAEPQACVMDSACARLTRWGPPAREDRARATR